ncbi:MAG: hypothetical protein J4F41_00225 [Alphaproteobacteria bacterium]|nr:hypothetical protein [Alphaproteobacteria bacterium]
MPFQFTADATFKWPVTIIKPVPDQPGQTTSHEFIGVFKQQMQHAHDALNDSLNEIDPRSPTALEEAAAINREWYRQILVDWEDILDGEGQPLPFSAANLDLLLTDPVVGLCISKAYNASQKQDAQKKN